VGEIVLLYSFCSVLVVIMVDVVLRFFFIF
jgi:hypothetical protein